MIDRHILCRTLAWAEFSLSGEKHYRLSANNFNSTEIRFMIYNYRRSILSQGDSYYTHITETQCIVSDCDRKKMYIYPFFFLLRQIRDRWTQIKADLDRRNELIDKAMPQRWSRAICVIVPERVHERKQTPSWCRTYSTMSEGGFTSMVVETGVNRRFVRPVTLNVRTRKDNICGGLIKRDTVVRSWNYSRIGCKDDFV